MSFDTVERLYALADAVLTLAGMLPEGLCGLALLLRLVGQNLKECAENIDDSTSLGN